MAKLSPRNARVKSAALAAFGPRGLTRLAEVSGVSKQLLSFICVGEREVTDEVYKKIAEGLIKAADEMKLGALKLDVIAGRMLRELDGE